MQWLLVNQVSSAWFDNRLVRKSLRNETKCLYGEKCELSSKEGDPPITKG